ncbi:DUF7333 family protein [Halocatena pleomorpha]|uniref:Uncharacterized protein n=1 Tax=Halocatena pleomorpha TaxID=1785090 RepID=A0A3P3RJU6_9EURY|nr:hypothetical protein [Halocatena pleomorpha]RRJ33089.1 hypothetical protein EIK79_03425 [Halocatena pleomorpha]
MEFDQPKAIGSFLVLLVALLGGTFSSPMPTNISMMVSVGLIVFGVLTFYIGVRHGEFRATR